MIIHKMETHEEMTRTYFMEICQLLLNFGRKAIVKVLTEYSEPDGVTDLIGCCKSDFKVYKRRVLSVPQWNLLYPKNKVGRYSFSG